ncbi:MAG: hypothetical protein ABIA12_02370 [Candidatus Aenigmatarchaeota archaeon]
MAGGGRRRPSNRSKREQALRAAFVKVLMGTPVKGVKFSKDNRSISLSFSGERVRYAIRVQREVYVGHWGRSTGIHIDSAMLSKGRGRSFRALVVHEAIEKFLVEKYGLSADRGRTQSRPRRRGSTSRPRAAAGGATRPWCTACGRGAAGTEGVYGARPLRTTPSGANGCNNACAPFSRDGRWGMPGGAARTSAGKGGTSGYTRTFSSRP